MFLLLGALPVSFSQEKAAPQDPFEAESLKLRALLHYDTAVGTPLDSLVRLYKNENREEELIGLYKAHIAKYPTDPLAKAVLTRVYMALERSEVDEFIQSAAQQHPDFSHLQYLLSVNLRKKDENRSLEALSRAIDLEARKNRKSQWLGELLDRSKTEKGRELSTIQLQKLLAVEGQTGQTMLSLAQVMQRHQFWELSLKALARALSQKLSPEENVEASVLAAKAEAALGKTREAGQRLDGVLAKLAPDHHRRNEIMNLRVSVIASNEERLALLEQKRRQFEATPEKEVAVLDYAEVLIASDNEAEAIKVLKQGSQTLPESTEIEKLALKLLEKRVDRKELVSFLNDRLEVQSHRSDLRYRLVKANFELNDTLAAEQDFELVLRGLESEEEKAARILDLARFLRSIEKEKFAVRYYEKFLTLQPARLDVTRELCEVFLKDGLTDRVKKQLAETKVEKAELENLLDLVQYLVEEQFFGSAEVLLKDYTGNSNALAFEPGLYLARVQGELGKREEASSTLEQLRSQTDTPARYKNWLNTSLLVNDLFGTIPVFFDAEQARFSFPDNQWSLEQIEKFLLLCEAGERRQLGERVARTIQTRLDSNGLDPSLKIKLRRLLVRTLERDTKNAAEVEKQLKLLVQEDPARTDEYRLRLALLYHSVPRIDLVLPILENLSLEKIDSSRLLRDSFKMLIEFGNRKLAGEALAAITRLEPSDLYSWEKRLSLLAAEGNEVEFRAVIRSLLQGIAQRGKTAEWREDTIRTLRWHLLDSYWRSIAGIFAKEDNMALALPLLSSVEREAQGHELLWVNWARAWVFTQLGRETERDVAIKQLENHLAASGNATLSFPDGLTIPLKVAVEKLKTGPSKAQPDATLILPLLDRPQIAWAFEADKTATILRMQLAGKTAVMILDDQGQVYRVDALTGKLLWKEALGTPHLAAGPPPVSTTENPSSVSSRIVREMLVSGDRFFLTFGDELRAYSCADCRLLWKASLPAPSVKYPAITTEMAFDGANNERIIYFDPSRNRLMAFSTGNGKLLWENSLIKEIKDPGQNGSAVNLSSTNTGLSVREGRILVYGRETAIYDSATGTPLWGFDGNDVRVFPVTLREKRDHLSDEEIETLDSIKPERLWVPQNTNGRRHDISHLPDEHDPGSNRQVLSFLNYPGSLLAPAVEWSRHRVSSGETAHALLSDDYVWLMNDGGLLQISLNLPLAAKHYDVSGTMLGETGGHAWVLNESGLIHIDGRKQIVNHFLNEEIGDKNIEGTLVGGWIYLRGNGGVAVYNALSGKRISRGTWDPAMISYLVSSPGGPEQLNYIWQGLVRRAAPGHPAYCYPSNDTVADGKYYMVYNGNQVVAVND